jgi:hypothetical protein
VELSFMDAPAALVLDFLEWLALKPRPYAEVMATWRTSCPRLTVWEDAVDAGLVRRTMQPGRAEMIELTDAGRSNRLPLPAAET